MTRPPGAVAAANAGLRTAYLRQVGDLLWPRPAVVTLRSGGGRRPDGALSEYLVVPNAARPRLLVPLRARRAAGAAVRRYTESRSWSVRLRARLLSAALRSGLAPVMMRDRLEVHVDAPGLAGAHPAETIETYLRAALDEDVVVSLHIGPARANRKPVLQLLTPDGATVGFAKLGISGLTRQLVRAEASALQALAGTRLRHVTVPRVRHHGTWGDMDVLVQSALPVWHRRVPLTRTRLVASMVEVATLRPPAREPLGESAYWRSLERRLELCAGPHAAVFGRLMDRIGSSDGGRRLAFGAWHGDWSPWNMATLPETVLLWDWERFATSVPLGFDLLHHDFQHVVARQPERATEAVDACLSRAPGTLRPFGSSPPEAEATAALYLVDLALRYIADGQSEPHGRLGVLGQLLVPIIINRLERR